MKKDFATREKRSEQDRIELYDEIDELLTTYCDGCFVFNHFKKEQGRRYAHRFCINQCTVGVKIKEIGKKLS
ncbi:zinc-finger domain-containing protein [Bacillus andreraoultii]|uniref:zinc-finger domain-containing protein n=1 Tax=Bacillus andreraoultii TaxID=1499685 RepID=UPI000539D868|nr:zinc-finger domain-containing protein [Bacillus andreraoultii]